MSDIKISVIAAMTKGERAIGIRNTLPWRLPADMALFKKHTLNKPVLMGRLTALSIRGPLPRRLNLVLTSGEAPFEGQIAVKSIEEAVQFVKSWRDALPQQATLKKEQLEGFQGSAPIQEYESYWAEWEKKYGSVDAKIDELMVIGGGKAYEAVLPHAHRLYLTQIDATYPDADAFFPEYDPYEWDIVHRETHPPEGNYHGFSFGIYERR